MRAGRNEVTCRGGRRRLRSEAPRQWQKREAQEADSEASGNVSRGYRSHSFSPRVVTPGRMWGGTHLPASASVRIGYVLRRKCSWGWKDCRFVDSTAPLSPVWGRSRYPRGTRRFRPLASRTAAVHPLPEWHGTGSR